MGAYVCEAVLGGLMPVPSSSRANRTTFGRAERAEHRFAGVTGWQLLLSYQIRMSWTHKKMNQGSKVALDLGFPEMWLDL